jgi:hypothetical protein
VSQLTRHDLWSALYYFLALPLVVVGAFLAADFGITVINALPSTMTNASWIGLTINTLPPLLCGMAAYAGLAAWLLRKRALTRTAGAHFLRAGMLYTLAVACGVILYRNWHAPDFGLWGQIPLWTGLAAAGGVFADAAIMYRKPSASTYAP